MHYVPALAPRNKLINTVKRNIIIGVYLTLARSVVVYTGKQKVHGCTTHRQYLRGRGDLMMSFYVVVHQHTLYALINNCIRRCSLIISI